MRLNHTKLPGDAGQASTDEDVPLTATEAAILGLLGLGESSGYDLSKRVESGVGMFWGPARSGIYAVLPRLVARGYATARAVPQERRPGKNVYRSTERGREALRRWIDVGPPEPDPASNPFLLRVYFGAEAGPSAVARHVEARRREAEERIALLGGLLAASAEPGARAPEPYRRLVLDWGLEYYEAVVRWADRTLAELRALEA